MPYFSKKDIRIIQKSISISRKQTDMLEELSIRSKMQEGYADGQFSESELIRIYDSSSKILENTRYLLSSLPTFSPDKQEELDAQAFKSSGYGFELSPRGWIRAVLPPPSSANQKTSHSRSALYKSKLTNAARLFLNNLPEAARLDFPLKKQTVTIKYLMDKSRHSYPDYDNFDAKTFLNVLCAARILYDDSPDCIRLFCCSVAAGLAATVIYILPDSDFADWLEQQNCDDEEQINLDM